MAELMNYLKIMILVQLFFSFGITILAYSMPNNTTPFINSYQSLAGDIDMANIKGDFESSLVSQLDIPAVEVGALVFYSGNILLDLLANFLFAVPIMIGLIISAITNLFSLDNFIVYTVQMFVSVVIGIIYIISLIQLLIGIRSGRVI